jgi:hypothetical protein
VGETNSDITDSILGEQLRYQGRDLRARLPASQQPYVPQKKEAYVNKPQQQFYRNSRNVRR